MSTLLGYLIIQLLRASPFTRMASARVYLLHTHPSFSIQEHRDALKTLNTQGFISDFRYIDASPKAAVIAIRS